MSADVGNIFFYFVAKRLRIATLIIDEQRQEEERGRQKKRSTDSFWRQDKMAESLLVLCDALCFLRNKFANTELSRLKSMLMDFYTVEALAEAKLRLLSDINDMSLPRKLPHIPQRRCGDNRLALEVDDMLSMFTFLDDLKAISQLPTYVSSGPDKMQSSRLFEGDLNILLILLNKMDTRLNAFEAALAAMTVQVRSLQAWPSLPEPSHAVSSQSAGYGSRDKHVQPPITALGNSGRLPSTSDQSSIRPAASAAASATGHIETATNWAESVAASTPISCSNRYTVLGSTTDDDVASQQSLTVVQPRRAGRRRPRSSDTQRPQETAPPNPSESHRQQQQQ